MNLVVALNGYFGGNCKKEFGIKYAEKNLFFVIPVQNR